MYIGPWQEYKLAQVIAHSRAAETGAKLLYNSSSRKVSSDASFRLPPLAPAGPGVRDERASSSRGSSAPGGHAARGSGAVGAVGGRGGGGPYRNRGTVAVSEDVASASTSLGEDGRGGFIVCFIQNLCCVFYNLRFC